jgi:trehalose 6-phosphate phosphatase
MREILAERGALLRFARPGTLVALDFDGTLAPIVPDPDRAALRPATRALVERLARAYPCAVISGRARADVARRLRGIPLAAIVGNHGLEAERSPRRRSALVARWRRTLEERLLGLPGVLVEPKGLSLAVHYRHAPDPGRARARVLGAARALSGARLVGGKRVLNVLPAGAGDKGEALARTMDRLGCARAVYVGDDDTDEDVFSRRDPSRVLAIRVGRRRGSAAPWFLRSQRDVDRLLRRLLATGSPDAGRLRPTLGEPLEFLRLLWAIDHGLHKRSKRMAATLGVTGPQRLVLRVVGGSPGISAGELAEVLHLHPSTLTGVLRRLQRRGLLLRGRDPRDARRAVLRLSAAAGRLAGVASGTIEATTGEVLGRVPRSQVLAARRVLQALAEAFAEGPARRAR